MMLLLTIEYHFNVLYLAVEGLKSVEIDKCKRDISEIKDQIWTAQKKFVDFNRIRYVFA
jgi:hypothetical protein